MAHHIPIHNINEILLITNTSISQIGIVYRACLIYQLIIQKGLTIFTYVTKSDIDGQGREKRLATLGGLSHAKRD